MDLPERTYIAIDLKSFYASVECRERGLDPMDTNLVVADESRTDKTICLAVTPSLKAYGVPGRGRLFEARQKVQEANALRRRNAPGHTLIGESVSARELTQNPSLAVGFLVARPRMAHYMEYSTRIYQVYMDYVSPEDIVVYSIDEVFMDVTAYLATYGLSPRELCMRIIRDVIDQTGITATAGIGTNLFLCKVAMDIVAKHMPPDENGVRIAQLDEETFRRDMWPHQPITDFWRVGRGIAKRLSAHGMHTLGDVARCSLRDEELLYRLFGKNAQLLIDHAWGWEPVTIADIKAYTPSTSSISSGQVLSTPYKSDRARLVLREMADALTLTLVDKGLVTSRVSIVVGYDVENLADPVRRARYTGPVEEDRYGRSVPKFAHGARRFAPPTSSSREILRAVGELFDQVVDGNLLIRRLNITAEDTSREEDLPALSTPEQLDLFTDYAAREAQEQKQRAQREREKAIQKATLAIRKRFGNNALLRGMSFTEGATAKDRNEQIGGHKA